MATWRTLAGLAAVGYGLLVLIGLVSHEARWLAVVSLALGAVLLWRRLPVLAFQRRLVVLVVGATCVGGTVVYNLWRGSGLSAPEWGLLGYGATLVVSAFHLPRRVGRTTVGGLVAWSFPLLLAPLAIFAANAAFTQGGADTSAGPLVRALVVMPTTIILRLLGFSVELLGNTMILDTPRGKLALGIGLVCAGLYPIIMFAGLLALYAWHVGMRGSRFLAHLGIGVVVLWFLNVVRIVILTYVGLHRGAAALQTVHAHLGWVLFVGFMTAYWAIAARHPRPAHA